MTYGRLAGEAGYKLELSVLQSKQGFYIGTADEEGPVSRESLEYWRSAQEATQALETGAWTQRDHC